MGIVDETIESTGGSGLYDPLLAALERLDQLLETAVEVAKIVYGVEAASDPYRGLYISQADVDRLLARKPAEAILYVEEGIKRILSDLPGDPSRLAWLMQSFALSDFEMNLIIIALAPELDLRYERLYAYLQDDVTRRRPGIELALNLLCSSAEEKLKGRRYFASDAQIIKHNIIQLLPDPTSTEAPLLRHFLKLDNQITSLLLGDDSLDRRLSPFCRRICPEATMGELTLSDELKQSLPTLVDNARRLREPLHLHFHGSLGSGKRHCAEALGGWAGMDLLTVDLAAALAGEIRPEQLFGILLREAWFKDAILYIYGADVLELEAFGHVHRLLQEALPGHSGITILSSNERLTTLLRGSIEFIDVPFIMPQMAERRAIWQRNFIERGWQFDDDTLDTLSRRFRLNSGQITNAVATAGNSARLHCCLADDESDLAGPQPADADLFAACRAQSGQELARLSRKIQPVYTWEEIVLPKDSFAQLRELCQRVKLHHRVFDKFGFGHRLSIGKGANALFAGPSGTGKTMAAEIVANELHLELYKIDLAGVVSKYIGETEKNLDKIFNAAESANAILFFDEADALFGQRSEVKDSHDRYANIEISYLLQKMEEYEGIAILATNLRQNLDDAFVRRLAFTIHFPFPDEANRREIWGKLWPAETELSPDIDVAFLARQFKLSGGGIKNVALAAAFLAAEQSSVVTMAHILHATRREYQKMGKALSEIELNGNKGPLQLAAKLA
jgi:AAA+ superfamily predicted ATPase